MTLSYLANGRPQPYVKNTDTTKPKKSLKSLSLSICRHKKLQGQAQKKNEATKPVSAVSSLPPVPKLPATIFQQADIPADHLLVVGHADAFVNTVDARKLFRVK